jgi:hypothetical protein
MLLLFYLLQSIVEPFLCFVVLIDDSIPSVQRQWTWRPWRRIKKTGAASSNGRVVAVAAPRGVEAWTATTPNGGTVAAVDGGRSPLQHQQHHPMSLEIAALGADGARLAAAAEAVANAPIATTLCPICYQQIPDWQIEMHADECLNGGAKNKSRAASSTLADDGKRSGSSAASSSSSGMTMGSPPTKAKPKKGNKGSKIVSSRTAAASTTNMNAALPTAVYLGTNGLQFPASQLANAPRQAPSAAQAAAASHSRWSCTTCTLKNPRNRPNCSACNSVRPFDL